MIRKTGFVGGLALAMLAALPAGAATIQYLGTLGPEVAGATGSGSASLTFDTVAGTMRVQADFSGLSSVTSVAHVHCCTATPNSGTAGVATTVPTFPGFPANVLAGTYDQTFDTGQLSTFNSAFVTANGGSPASALAALLAGLDAEKAYLNIHTQNFPGGEIRAFLHRVPEPGSLALLMLGLGGTALQRTRPGLR